MQHLYFNVGQSLSLSREYLNIHLPYLLCILNKSTGSTFFLAQHKMYKYIKEVFIRQEFTDLNHFIFIYTNKLIYYHLFISPSPSSCSFLFLYRGAGTFVKTHRQMPKLTFFSSFTLRQNPKRKDLESNEKSLLLKFVLAKKRFCKNVLFSFILHFIL